MKKLFLVPIAIGILVTACKKDEPEPNNEPTPTSTSTSGNEPLDRFVITHADGFELDSVRFQTSGFKELNYTPISCTSGGDTTYVKAEYQLSTPVNSGDYFTFTAYHSIFGSANLQIHPDVVTSSTVVCAEPITEWGESLNSIDSTVITIQVFN